jgi:hypothetical protein
LPLAFEGRQRTAGIVEQASFAIRANTWWDGPPTSTIGSPGFSPAESKISLVVTSSTGLSMIGRSGRLGLIVAAAYGLIYNK